MLSTTLDTNYTVHVSYEKYTTLVSHNTYHTLYDDGTVGTNWRNSEFDITFHELVASSYNKLFTGFGWFSRLKLSRR